MLIANPSMSTFASPFFLPVQPFVESIRTPRPYFQTRLQHVQRPTEINGYHQNTENIMPQDQEDAQHDVAASNDVAKLNQYIPCEQPPITATISTPTRPLNEVTNTSRIPFSKRTVKSIPKTFVSSSRDDSRELRRKTFLRQVDDRRDEKRFERRGEDILRREYLEQRRERELRFAEEAPEMPGEMDDVFEESLNDDEGMVWSQGASTGCESTPQGLIHRPEVSSMNNQPVSEVDAYLQWEDEELNALLDYVPESPQHASNVVYEHGVRRDDRAMAQEQNLWSDDDDYDALFSEVLSQTQADTSHSADVEMDFS